MKKQDSRARVVIENVRPQIDGGQFPIKRISGELVNVSADVFGDGHDVISARLLYRKKGEKKWNENPFRLIENDQFVGQFRIDEEHDYEYAVMAWIDHALTWYEGFLKKKKAGDHLDVEIQIGLGFLDEIAKAAKGNEQRLAKELAAQIRECHYQEAVELCSGERLRNLIEDSPIRKFASISESYGVQVDRLKASFSAWYEFFPRSSSPDSSRPGTFNDCFPIVDRLAELGFDTLYFPPIHPIGRAHRKGKNNSTTAQPGEPGSPWAIGASEGGHTGVLSDLGTEADFIALVAHARTRGIEIAMDLAYQCSPDHPWVKEHPDWFKWRPDGTVQYAENPPKKYQDVLPIYFECDDWKNLWDALKGVIEYWIDKGVKVFRVDNPHTKPFAFWEWVMAEMHRDHPEVLFLSEAFTRPKIMARLAKIGFHQSYSYFTWRKNKAELSEYLGQLTQTELRDYFRANFWPNTPDILPEYLQNTGFSNNAIRYVLAATLSSNYGMYGPVYEYLINSPVPGKEEYIDSEKYEVRHWDWSLNSPFHHLIGKINHIRRQNPAFYTTFNLQFCETDNPMVMAYFKQTEDRSNAVLVVVNLDPYQKQSAWIKTPLDALGIAEGEIMELNDLMDDSRYHWNRNWNYVELDPRLMPCHIFNIRIHR